ncbi:hypothetical protein ACFPYI_01815 [Halomarina salina]|uniref:Uncharacterized protein n=1 Tax=Halomarina salina TaxID=1872699 RepID=A0ABD5RHP5_9EURY|nr:hypothetical protein [Halomarina salina]
MGGRGKYYALIAVFWIAIRLSKIGKRVKRAVHRIIALGEFIKSECRVYMAAAAKLPTAIVNGLEWSLAVTVQVLFGIIGMYIPALIITTAPSDMPMLLELVAVSSLIAVIAYFTGVLLVIQIRMLLWARGAIIGFLRRQTPARIPDFERSENNADHVELWKRWSWRGILATFLWMGILVAGSEIFGLPIEDWLTQTDYSPGVQLVYIVFPLLKILTVVMGHAHLEGEYWMMISVLVVVPAIPFSLAVANSIHWEREKMRENIEQATLRPFNQEARRVTVAVLTMVSLSALIGIGILGI